MYLSYFRHALPLFTSLLNVICSYDPVGYGVPYNHLMSSDSREPLVEVCLQVLCVCLENDVSLFKPEEGEDDDDEDLDRGDQVSFIILRFKLNKF